MTQPTTTPSNAMRPIRVAVLTVSDRCASGSVADESGPALVALLTERLAVEIVATSLVPDVRVEIADTLRRWALEAPRPDLVLTTGGTGLGPRDITPEATLDVLERRHPALLELARLRVLPQSPHAFLSRGEAGAVGETLIVNLPGSPRGATETLATILDVLPHAIRMLRGGDHAR